MPAPFDSGPAVSHTNTYATQPKTQAERIIEDKTFGLKNKSKSKKVQQYVQTVTAQTKHNVRTKIGRVSASCRSIESTLVRCCPYI